MDGGAWWATVHRVAKSRTERLHFHFTFLEKEMTIHSSTIAWKIPWTDEPGGLQSTGRKESDTTELPHFHFHFQSLREPQSWDSPGLFHCGSCAAFVSHHL